MTEPTQVRKRAIDVTPLEHAIWCVIGDGEPFANTIVLRRWSDDGTQVVFMLDSHNFLFANPDEEIDVIEKDTPFYNIEFQTEELRRDAEKMRTIPNRPAS